MGATTRAFSRSWRSETLQDPTKRVARNEVAHSRVGRETIRRSCIPRNGSSPSRLARFHTHVWGVASRAAADADPRGWVAASKPTRGDGIRIGGAWAVGDPARPRARQPVVPGDRLDTDWAPSIRAYRRALRERAPVLSSSLCWSDTSRPDAPGQLVPRSPRRSAETLERRRLRARLGEPIGASAHIPCAHSILCTTRSCFDVAAMVKGPGRRQLGLNCTRSDQRAGHRAQQRELQHSEVIRKVR